MGTIFGSAIDIDSPFFEETDDDATIAKQLAIVALDTPPGSLDAFPEYGFQMRAVVLKGMTPTEIALLPLELRGALEQEPAFVTAEVAVTSQSVGPGPGATMALACSITAAEGDAIGFTIGT